MLFCHQPHMNLLKMQAYEYYATAHVFHSRPLQNGRSTTHKSKRCSTEARVKKTITVDVERTGDMEG